MLDESREAPFGWPWWPALASRWPRPALPPRVETVVSCVQAMSPRLGWLTMAGMAGR
jgi:hypothetical protein